jgi:hypothetical protein
MNLSLFPCPAIGDDADDIRNHFSAPLEPDPIMDVDIFVFDEIEIMQADSLEGRSAKLDRIKVRDWCDNSCSSYLEIH